LPFCRRTQGLCLENKVSAVAYIDLVALSILLLALK
jgi:hypothetical protein